MRLYIVSDLHIAGAEDPLYASLLKLVRSRAQAGDTVVLAGDVFDLFVGNKEIFVERYRDFLAALREAGSRGVRIHYIEGNHDFLIRKAFDGIEGLTLHSDQFSLETGGKRFFFAHGDKVDRKDYGYRALRAFFRSPVMRAFVAAAPGRWIEEIGTRSSRGSRGRKPVLAGELPLERRERLRRIYRSFAAERMAQGFDFVVLGHCHDLDEMKFQIGARTGQYMNVGYPRVHRSLLSWAEGDTEIQREALP